MVFENIIEPPQTLGVLGLETWFITKFTLEDHPQFAIFLGLQGEENREMLAQTFKRPTTWLDYCTQVSPTNCTIPDNVTQRPPHSNTEEEVQYYSEGNYIGHFRYTEDNDCELHPTTCTGHIADFPCNWDSFVQSQIKYLNIPLKSSGPEEPIGGYPYARLVELWRAANATKSNLIMHYWTPEPLVQEFVDTEAEFIRITMPPPSQLCADSRRPEKYQCSYNSTLRYGVDEGVCEESSKNLYKLVVGNLYDVIFDDQIPEPIRSPAYDALRLFELSELQLGQIFDYLHKSNSLPYHLLENTNGTNISRRNITARDAVCHWVIENLESTDSAITSSSKSMAGENDTLPIDGLCIGNVRILPSDTEYVVDNTSTNDTTTKYYTPIKLLVGRNGWGTGVHPTTRLCLEWLCDTVRSGDTVLDYGCGSGILSITALHMGAKTVYGVDVEAEALVTAVRNVQNNGYDNDDGDDDTPSFVPLHTREVLPYGINPPTGVDLCVANILIGQLIRPSMVAALMTNIVPGGLLCLSGIRPGDQVDTLKQAYQEHVEWMMEEYMELSAAETPSSIDSYGFDCGTWCRLVGRKVSTRSRSEDITSMSDLAVS